MYQNKVSLIGFLGGDAEVRNANNRSFSTLSLATKSSYKDKNSGQYVAQTEWHRCVVFGKLAEFAATLTKGAHTVRLADRHEPRTGRAPLGQIVERRTRCRTYYATAAVQRPALFRCQYPLSLDECHRARLRRSHLDDLPPGN